MTKNYLILKNVAIIVACCAALSVFSGCQKDDPDNPDNTTYNPPANMTSAEIVALIREANTKLLAENEVAIVMTDKEGYDVTVVNLEYNLSDKKLLELATYDRESEFNCYNASTHYYAYDEMYNYDEMYSEKLSTAFWKYSIHPQDGALPGQSDDYFTYFNEYYLDLDIEWKWKVEGGKFVAYDNNNRKTAELTLNNSKKYLNAKMNDDDGRDINCDYSYTANPALPSGYSTSQFPLQNQVSLNVNWGGTYGTDTYYNEYLSNDDAPKVNGKLPVFYTDAAFTHLITQSTSYYFYYFYDSYYGYSWSLYVASSESGKTIYAKWENASTVYSQYGSRYAPAKQSVSSSKKHFGRLLK